MEANTVEIMLNHPPLSSNNPLLNKNPLDLELIQSYQQKDIELQKVVQEDKSFFTQSIRDVSLVHHITNDLVAPKIVITHALQYAAIRWMHSLLGHTGITRLAATLRKHFWFPNIGF